MKILGVYPAADFPEMAKRLGAKLVFLNREATPLDGLADLVIHGEIGDLLADQPICAGKGWKSQ